MIRLGVPAGRDDSRPHGRQWHRGICACHKHRRIVDMTPGDFDGLAPELFFVDPDIYLATYSAFRPAMLASIPRGAFALRLDAGAVGQEVQWAGSAPIRQTSRSASSGGGTGYRNPACPSGPASRNRLSTKPAVCLSSIPNQDLQGCQTRLDRVNRGVAEPLLTTTFVARRRHPVHVRIKPDRQRPALLRCGVVRRPFPGPVLRSGPTTHTHQLSRWIQKVNPKTYLCNKAVFFKETFSTLNDSCCKSSQTQASWGHRKRPCHDVDDH